MPTHRLAHPLFVRKASFQCAVACVITAMLGCEESPPQPARAGALNEGAGTAVGNYSPAVRSAEVQTRFKTVADAIATYEAFNEQLPATLGVLVEEGIIVKESMLVDPWQQPLRYERTDTGFRVWTIGPDGENGTDDDEEMKG